MFFCLYIGLIYMSSLTKDNSKEIYSQIEMKKLGKLAVGIIEQIIKEKEIEEGESEEIKLNFYRKLANDTKQIFELHLGTPVFELFSQTSDSKCILNIFCANAMLTSTFITNLLEYHRIMVLLGLKKPILVPNTKNITTRNKYPTNLHEDWPVYSLEVYRKNIVLFYDFVKNQLILLFKVYLEIYKKSQDYQMLEHLKRYAINNCIKSIFTDFKDSIKENRIFLYISKEWHKNHRVHFELPSTPVKYKNSPILINSKNYFKPFFHCYKKLDTDKLLSWKAVCSYEVANLSLGILEYYANLLNRDIILRIESINGDQLRLNVLNLKADRVLNKRLVKIIQ